MSFNKSDEEKTKSLEVALNASESTFHLPAHSLPSLSEPSWTPSCSPPRFLQRTSTNNSETTSGEELGAHGQIDLPGVRFQCRQQHPGSGSEASGQMRAAHPYHPGMSSTDTTDKREEGFPKQHPVLEPTLTTQECPTRRPSSRRHCAQCELLSQSSIESHQHPNPGAAGMMRGVHHCEFEPSCADSTDKKSPETALSIVDHDYCDYAVDQETTSHLSHPFPTALTSQPIPTEPSSTLSHQNTSMNVERIWDLVFRTDQAPVTTEELHTFYSSAILAHIQHLQHLQTMVLYLIEQLPQSTLTDTQSLVLSHLGDLNLVHLSNLTLFLMSQLQNYFRYSHLLPVENILPLHVPRSLNLVSLNFSIVSAEVPSDEALLNLMESLGEDRPHNLTTDEIKQLPSYRFDPSNHMSKETQCVICLCQFEAQQLLCVLPCNHVFHIECVSEWLKIKRTCPVCRTDALMVQQES